MSNNYTFIDASGVTQTAASSVVNGAHQPLVQIASMVGGLPVTLVAGVQTSITGGISSVSQVGQWNMSPSSVQVMAGTNIIGSVATLQGTNPWVVQLTSGSIATTGGTTGNSSVMLTQGTNTIGSVATLQGTNPWIVNSTGSVLATNYLQRNDTVASALGVDLTYRPVAGDSAGRILNKPFAPEEARVEGIAVLTSTSVTTMVAAAGTGLKNYITDVWLANTGSVATLVTFKDGAGSILGYTIAPATSGSNLPGLATPIRTGANATFDIQATTATSTLYGTVKGYRAP